MPSTLKRSQRRELVLTRSFESAIKSKVYVSYTAPHSGWTPYESDTPRVHFMYNTSIRSFQAKHFIHYLPPEVLARIFEIGSEGDPMFPIAVAGVCRFWHNLAHHTPAIWRRITLGPPANMWRERIRRAKSCSLDIQLKPWNFFKGGSNQTCFLTAETVQWYMHLVMPYIFRWRSLDISFARRAPYLWNAALSGCCGIDPSLHAPLIERVSLVYRGNDDTKQFTLFGGVAPRLRSVTLDGLRLTWLPSLFSNLTSLDYTHHAFSRGKQAVSQVLSMLEISKYIVRLSVLFPSKCSLPLTSNQPSCDSHVVLHRLTDLELRVDGPDIPIEICHLTARLSTPALSSLRLLDLTRSPSPFPGLRNFLDMPALPASVCALHMENGWFDRHFVPSLWQTLPRLQILTAKHQSLSSPLRVDLRSKVHRSPVPTWHCS